MTSDGWIALTIFILMFVMLIWNKFPTWLVFMGTLTVAMTLQLADAQKLLSGFANIGVLTVAALFPVAAGMYATGAVTYLADRLIGRPKSLREAQLKILPPVAIGSAFLNNTPLVAMMIPVTRDLSRTTKLAASKLLIPLSFASLLGGAATVIGTSTNLIIAGMVNEHIADGSVQGMGPINVFAPALIGIPAAVAGLLFLIRVSNQLLPEGMREADAGAVKANYRAEFVVDPGSRLEGKDLGAAGFSDQTGFVLKSITHVGGTRVEVLHPGQILQGRDILTFFGSVDALSTLWTTAGLRSHCQGRTDSGRHRHRLVAAVVSPNSPAVGRRIAELPLPESPYRMDLVGLSRSGNAPDVPLKDLTVQSGDAVILEVEDSFFYENRLELDFVLTKRLRGHRIQRTDKAIVATIITAFMVLLAASSVLSMLNAALLATGAMLLTGCLTVRRIWQSIEWETIVVLGAAVGLEAAVTASGLSRVAADLLTELGGSSQLAALAAVFCGAVVMANLVTKAAAAAFMFPVALALAHHLNASFMPFVMILMLATSYAFISPVGSHTNLMVQKPGGYGFMDFVKVGLPLTFLAGFVALALAPWVYGF